MEVMVKEGQESLQNQLLLQKRNQKVNKNRLSEKIGQPIFLLLKLFNLLFSVAFTF